MADVGRGKDPIFGAATVWELAEARAEASPHALAFADEHGRSVTFGELTDSASRAAAGFAALGLGAGDVVTWQLPTRIDTVVVTLALARLGATQSPILHLYRERETGFALRELAPAAHITLGPWQDVDFAAMARSVLDGAGLSTDVVDVDEGLPTGDPATLPPPPGRGDEVRWIYYTSGTSTDPKGVRHTDASLIAGGEGLARAVGYRPDDVGSVAFPFAHVAGADYLVVQLAVGFASVVVESFVPSEAARLFASHGVTLAGGSTPFYAAFLAEQRKHGDTAPIIPTLRLMAGGGAPKPPELSHAVRQVMGVPILHGYGMTEAPMISMGRTEDSDEQLAYTDGVPVDGVEIRVVDAAGAPVAPGTDGEILVRGPVVCAGYTEPVATATAFDAEGWLRTGDLGHVRDDGHLVITGRAKDIVIRKGENISARAVEDVLHALPEVGDVAVIGLPDPERGERVCAVVESAAGMSPLTFDTMVAACTAAGLMTQMIPEELQIVDSLPRAGTLNKVSKQALRERFGAGS